MYTLLDGMFIGDGFEKNDNYSNFCFWKKEDKEYYITIILDRNSFEIFDVKNILDEFDKIKKEKSDIEKNTSLIIFVKLDNLETEFIELKNRIMDIEENEYWFKKYVVVYTNNSLINLKNASRLNEVIFDELRFDNFKENLFADDEYFFTIQLFMKIPFLKIGLKESVFSNLGEMIDNKLVFDQKQMVSRILDIKYDEDSKKLDDASLQEFFNEYNI